MARSAAHVREATNSYGASADDWLCFGCELSGLGLFEHLVPIVSDPHVQPSARSSISDFSKIPSTVTAAGCAVGFTGWPEHRGSMDDVRRWMGDGRLGAAIVCREIRAVDIDVEEAWLSREIANFVDAFLETPLPRRVRNNSGRVAQLVRVVSDQPVGKAVVDLWPQDGKIEFLGDRQILVLAGTHRSGARIEWEGGLPRSIPEVPLAKYLELIDRIAEQYGRGEVSRAAVHERGVDAPAADPVADFLIAEGLTHGASADGRKLYVDCPKLELHSSVGDPTQTCWMTSGFGGFDRGHFDCRHTSHGKITDAEFLEHIGFAEHERAQTAAEFDVVEDGPETPPAVPCITVSEGELHVAATAGEQALIAAQVPFYVRGETIVRPVIEAAPAAHGRETWTARLTRVGDDMMVDHLSRCARWVKHDARRRGLAPTNPPAQVARIILARDGDWQLPPLAGVITTPTLRPDGSLLATAGYDAATRLLLVNPPALPTLAEDPTRDDAEAALNLLDSLLDGFPFVGDASRSVALSALISPVVRGALPVVPLHAFSAPAPGTGKSYLVDLVAAIQTGERAPVITAGRAEEETEKRLASALMLGQPIISIDNVNGDIGGDLLCQAVERPLLNVRPLGSSKLVRIHNSACLFVTGNNVHLVEDMSRRVLLCSLDANQERPELRQFSSDPFGDVLRERGRYIAAALTVVRAYLAAGRLGALPRLASFNECDLVRSALVWLGREDPVETMEKARADDPAAAQLSALLPAWHELLGGESLTLKEVRAKLDAEIVSPSAAADGLRDALAGLAPGRHGSDFDSRRLGLALVRYEGRIIDGLKLVKRYDGHSKQQTWAVRSVQSAGSAG